MATICNLATMGSRLHRTEMIGRRLCRADKTNLQRHDRNNTDIQAVAIGEAYGADHYHDDVPGSRWRGSLLVVMAVLALAVLAGTFAYRAMFGGSVFPALPPIIKAGTGPNNIVRNNSDIRQSNSSQTSITSAGSSKKLQPMDIREAPKAVPRVISTVPISSRLSTGPVAPRLRRLLLRSLLIRPRRQLLISTLHHPSRRLPRLRYQSGFLGAERDYGGRAGCARAGCAFARSYPAAAHGSIGPAARLGSGASTGFLGAERDCGGARRLRASRVRLRPLLSRRCSRQHLSRRPPRLRASTGFLGAERDYGGRAGCARAGCAFARSCPAAAHGSICPAARLGSGAVPASSEPKETAAVAPVAREPGAPSPALVPPLLTVASVPPPASALSEPKEIHRVIVGPDGGGKRINPRRPRSLTLRGMRRRYRPLVLLCRRVAGPLWKCPPAAPTRFRWPPNAVRPRPTRPFGRSGPNSRTSLAGASRSCAALISVRRASTTAPWSAPLRHCCWNGRSVSCQRIASLLSAASSFQESIMVEFRAWPRHTLAVGCAHQERQSARCRSP